MSKKINIILLNKEMKKMDTICIETPQNLEGLLLSINKHLKILPENFVIFYIHDKKEIDIQTKDEFKLLKEILYIRPKNPKDKEQVIFKKININNITESSQKNTTDENKKNQPEKENEKKNEQTENIGYFGKFFNYVKVVLNMMKEITFLSSNTDLPYSCIPRIESEYPDISYDNNGKE